MSSPLSVGTTSYSANLATIFGDLAQMESDREQLTRHLRALAADLDASGQVLELDGGRGFVYFLPTCACAAYKAFLQVLLAKAQALHPLREFRVSIEHDYAITL